MPAVDKRFNEDSLRADVVKIWGEHGAHVDVLDMLIKRARRIPPTPNRYEVVWTDGFKKIVKVVDIPVDNSGRIIYLESDDGVFISWDNVRFMTKF